MRVDLFYGAHCPHCRRVARFLLFLAVHGALTLRPYQASGPGYAYPDRIGDIRGYITPGITRVHAKFSEQLPQIRLGNTLLVMGELPRAPDTPYLLAPHAFYPIFQRLPPGSIDHEHYPLLLDIYKKYIGGLHKMMSEAVVEALQELKGDLPFK